jgi:hypothetical protein
MAAGGRGLLVISDRDLTSSFVLLTLHLYVRVCPFGAHSYGSFCVLFSFFLILHVRFLFDYDTHLSVEA